MKQRILLCIFFQQIVICCFSQIPSFGIGQSIASSSSLLVDGSLSAGLTTVTSNTYAVSGIDCNIAWNGSATGNFVLPAALPVGSGNYQGRLYFIKNISITYPLTLTATGAELIDIQSGTNVSSFTLQPGYFAIIVSKGTTSGATWEMAMVGASNYIRPYFTATRSAFTPGSGGVNVSGYTELADDRNNFNPTTGAFTAPEDGYYIFNYSTTTNASAGGVLAHRLSTGSSSQRINIQSNTSYSQSFSNCYFIKMTKGTTISYFVAFAATSGSGSVTSTFSGLKLR